jgi:hypothetical protein
LMLMAMAAAVGRDEMGTDRSATSLAPRWLVREELLATGRAEPTVTLRTTLRRQLFTAQPTDGGIQKFQPVTTPLAQPLPPVPLPTPRSRGESTVIRCGAWRIDLRHESSPRTR